MALSSNRIKKEIKEMADDPPSNCSAGPITEDNILKWAAVITGPEDTPVEGGIFHLTIDIPADYPFRPPLCKFKTRVFHPNINKQGDICLDILKTNWSPALNISKLTCLYL